MNIKEKEVMEQYVFDLYGIILKKLHTFIKSEKPMPEMSIKLMAILQELIKVKEKIQYDAYTIDGVADMQN